MFILLTYKDDAELSGSRLKNSETDFSVERTLLVNPDCYARIMVEYIRKVCKLGAFTQFDLCDESGVLKGLYSLPTYTYATDLFTNKKVYYIIVLRQELDKRISIYPQINRHNKLYPDLKNRISAFLQQTPSYVSVITPSSVTVKTARTK